MDAHNRTAGTIGDLYLNRGPDDVLNAGPRRGFPAASRHLTQILA